MFTGKVRESADRLKSSLERVGLNFVIYEVPTVHCSISTAGTDDIVFCKPNFINYIQNEYRMPVLYVDADVVFHDVPAAVYNFTQECIDFASYNWLADAETDAYIPKTMIFNGTLSKNRFYKFSHSVEMFDPTQLIGSGAVQYYTPRARLLLQYWLDATVRFPNAVDDQILDYTYNFLIQKTLIRAYWLPKDYCRYPWWIYVRPVIGHPEFPTSSNPNRNFETVAGHKRVKMESIKILPSQGPFPHDCLIDTQEKCFLRPNNSGGAEVVGRFATELWIDSRS